jgi:hypothetical protein
MFMVVFACFNVVLESPRQAVFFWFFVCGAYLAPDMRPASAPATPLLGAGGWRTVLAWAVAGGLLGAYALAVASPGNRFEALTVYAPENGGQVPRFYHPIEGKQRIVQLEEGIALDLEPLPSGWCSLAWVMPEHFAQRVGDLDEYVVEVGFADALPAATGLHVTTASGEVIELQNSSIKTNTVEAQLGRLGDVPPETIRSFTLFIPHDDKRTLRFLIERVRILRRPGPCDYPVYEPSRDGQIPGFYARDARTQRLEASDAGLTLSLAPAPGAYCQLWWEMPHVLPTLTPCAAHYFLEITFDRPVDDDFSVLFEPSGRPVIRGVNVTPGIPVMTVPLSPLLDLPRDALDRHVSVSLHVPHRAQESRCVIRSLRLRYRDAGDYESWIFFAAGQAVALPKAYHQAASARTDVRLQPPFLQVDVHKPANTWATLSWPFPKLMLSRPDIDDYAIELVYRDARAARRLRYSTSATTEDWLPATEVRVQGRTVRVPLRQFSSVGLGTLTTFNINPADKVLHSAFSIESVRLIRARAGEGQP